MNRKIIFQGSAGEALGEEWSVNAPTVADAFRVVHANNPKKYRDYFEQDLEAEFSVKLAGEALEDADYMIIATPTDYDHASNYFDTSSVDELVSKSLVINKEALIVIKSTLPVGHTEFLREKHCTKRIIFSPEFLREGYALDDNLNPSRIIVGGNCRKSKIFADLLKESSLKKDIKTLFLESADAEAVKLFSNTYLAMRVSFFNELDSFALSKGLDTKKVIEGVCSDERIGDGYNNPSFGYGGYCLPKDTKQLLANYELVPQTLIKAVVESNEIRKEFIFDQIVSNVKNTIGFYRLEMKKGSNNFRSSAIISIINRIKDKNTQLVIYEPLISENSFEGIKVVNNLEKFKEVSELIVANRIDEEIKDIAHKCFSRDIFGKD